jgi:hypothetical protein
MLELSCMLLDGVYSEHTSSYGTWVRLLLMSSESSERSKAL